jgi:uncharacterized ParB-like nuclease family protein
VRDLVDRLDEADASSALGEMADGAGDRVAVPVPLASITATIQVCGVNPGEADIAALAANIAEVGLLHPVEVSPTGNGRFTLTKGNSRLLAHQRLGRDTIPAFVAEEPLTESNWTGFVRAQASENAHRKHLSILEILNTMHELASAPCLAGRNEIGRIMKLPEATLKRYWRVYRVVRERHPLWHPAVAAWLNTPEATWALAARFAADPLAQQVFADTGALPGARRARVTASPASIPAVDEEVRSGSGGGSIDPPPEEVRFVVDLVARVRAVLAELRAHSNQMTDALRVEVRADLAACLAELE